MRPMASGHGTSSSPPPPLPTCVVPLNTIFFLEGFQRGRAQSWHDPRFYLRKFIGGFQKRACPVHGTCFDFTSLYRLMWFDSLPLLGPGGLAIFFFAFVLFLFGRERDIKAPRFPAYPLSLQLCSFRFEPAWVRPLLLLGMVLGPYAGPWLLRPQSEI